MYVPQPGFLSPHTIPSTLRCTKRYLMLGVHYNVQCCTYEHLCFNSCFLKCRSNALYVLLLQPDFKHRLRELNRQSCHEKHTRNKAASETHVNTPSQKHTDNIRSQKHTRSTPASKIHKKDTVSEIYIKYTVSETHMKYSLITDSTHIVSYCIHPNRNNI